MSAVFVFAGFIGYTAYCPSKYAVRGLAECLRNEVGSRQAVAACKPTSYKVLWPLWFWLHPVCMICHTAQQCMPACHALHTSSSLDGRQPLFTYCRCFSLLVRCIQLQGSKVKVSIAYPADISTPGYVKENLKKVRRYCGGLPQFCCAGLSGSAWPVAQGPLAFTGWDVSHKLSHSVLLQASFTLCVR
jgi:hypothetical protein